MLLIAIGVLCRIHGFHFLQMALAFLSACAIPPEATEAEGVADDVLLTDDIFDVVFPFLDRSGLVCVRLVSRAWHAAASQRWILQLELQRVKHAAIPRPRIRGPYLGRDRTWTRSASFGACVGIGTLACARL